MGSKIKLLEKDVGEVRREMADLNERLRGLERNMSTVPEFMMEMKESFAAREERRKSPLVQSLNRDHLVQRANAMGSGGGVVGAHCQQRRLEIPIFSGEDPCGWILKAEKYFMLYGVEEGDKVAYTTLCMEGKALNWLLWMEAWNPIHGWQMFKDELMQRFRSLKPCSAMKQLRSLRQWSTVAQYREQFELLSAPLRGMSVELLRCAFIDGLNDDVKAEVELSDPRDLSRVMSLAQEIEDRNKILERMEEVALTRNFGDYSKSSSFDEMAPGNVDSNEVRSYPLHEAAPIRSQNPRKTGRSTVETDSPQNFKLLGKIGSREVIVLIGTSATHNFISKQVVTELQLPVERTRRFLVKSAFGHKVEGAELCNNVVLETQGIEIVNQRFFILDLGNADVVLGGEWLRTLGKYSVGCNDTFTLTFKWQGRKVALQADPSVANFLRVDEEGYIIRESWMMILQWDEEH